MSELFTTMISRPAAGDQSPANQCDRLLKNLQRQEGLEQEQRAQQCDTEIASSYDFHASLQP
jgi:hypothetical protein